LGENRWQKLWKGLRSQVIKPIQDKISASDSDGYGIRNDQILSNPLSKAGKYILAVISLFGSIIFIGSRLKKGSI
jgi:hypothetical protein